MDIKKLEVLLKVIETQNLTMAGDEMGFTQSGVSHLIKSIENELGFQILIRGKTGVMLTENGKDIMPAVRDIVNANERLGQIASNICGMRFGRIRIGSYSSVSVFWLPKIIAQFSKDYPGIQIELFEGGKVRLEEMLSDGAIDFAFMSSPSGSWDWVPLATDRMLAMVPHNHKLAKLDHIKITQLAAEPFIMRAAGFDSDIEHILQECETKPHVAFSSSDDHAIISMVQHGLGVSIVPEMILSGISTNVAVRELYPCEYRQLGVAVRSRSQASLAARTFIKYSEKIIGGRETRLV